MQPINSQELRSGQEGPATQVHGVFEHQKEVKVANQVPNQLIDNTKGKKKGYCYHNYYATVMTHCYAASTQMTDI